MNKEDILDKHAVGVAAGQYTIECDKANQAMDEYAKQQCIELLNWMFAGASETIPYPGQNMWLRDLGNEYKDSAALYDAFLTEHSL